MPTNYISLRCGCVWDDDDKVMLGRCWLHRQAAVVCDDMSKEELITERDLPEEDRRDVDR